MTVLQKIVLGTPPAAVDGDPVRTASTKMNANVDVLNTQAILSSFATTLTAAQALTAANHLGKRVNINLAASGTINLPTASTCVADGVIHLRNVGATLVTLAITAGSGDTIALTTLAAGESALMDTDGVHAWTCAMRGRTNSANEVVQGNCSVLGNETVGGTLAVTGVATLANTVLTNAPTYPSTAVARAAFKNDAAGKAMVIINNARIDYGANTQTIYAPGAAGYDAVGSWNGSNTFSTPSAGVFKVTARWAWASGYSSTDYIDVFLNTGSGTVLGHQRTFAPAQAQAYWNFGIDRYVSMGAGTTLYISITATLGFYMSPDGGFNMLAIEQVS